MEVDSVYYSEVYKEGVVPKDLNPQEKMLDKKVSLPQGAKVVDDISFQQAAPKCITLPFSGRKKNHENPQV